MLDLDYLNKFGNDLVAETDRLIQVKSALEGIKPETLYKAELTGDGRNIAYTPLENIPGIKDIATDTSDFIRERMSRYLEDKSADLRECITAMVADMTKQESADSTKDAKCVNTATDSVELHSSASQGKAEESLSKSKIKSSIKSSTKSSVKTSSGQDEHKKPGRPAKDKNKTTGKANTPS